MKQGIRPGMKIYIPAVVKYVRTSLNSRDQICVDIGGKELWLDMPKKKQEQEDKDG